MVQYGHQLKVRLPSDVKAFVEAEARWNASSLSSEIVRCIRERMTRKSAAEGATSPRHEPAESLEGNSND